MMENERLQNRKRAFPSNIKQVFDSLNFRNNNANLKTRKITINCHSDQNLYIHLKFLESFGLLSADILELNTNEQYQKQNDQQIDPKTGNNSKMFE